LNGFYILEVGRRLPDCGTQAGKSEDRSSLKIIMLYLIAGWLGKVNGK